MKNTPIILQSAKMSFRWDGMVLQLDVVSSVGRLFLAGRDDQFSLPERYFLTGRYGNFRWKIFFMVGLFFY